MRLLERNKKPLWYALRTGSTYITDSNGHKTGDKEQAYGNPVRVMMSMAISSCANNLGSQGIAELEPWGIVTGYTARAVTEDMTCPIAEDSRIWYGIEPTKVVQVQKTVNGQTVTVDETVSVPHNYKVVRRAESINHLIFYLKEVDVS